jgi:hypothetical protein
MDKKDINLIADALLRIKTIEALLLEKGVFTVDDYSIKMNDISKKISKSILEKANVDGKFDDILKAFDKDN